MVWSGMSAQGSATSAKTVLIVGGQDKYKNEEDLDAEVFDTDTNAWRVLPGTAVTRQEFNVVWPGLALISQ